MARVSDLDRTLGSVARRLRAASALEEGARFGLLLAPLGLGVAVARPLVPHGALAALPAREALLVTLAPAALGALAGAVRGALSGVARERAARLAEERAPLGAAFTTALELRKEESAWRPLVEQEADALARSLSPSSVAPLTVPRRARTLALVVLTALAVFFLPIEKLQANPPEPPEKPVSKPALDAIAKAGAELRRASEALPAGDARRSLDESGKELRTFLSELEAGELGKRDALARLGEAEERLRVESERAEARTQIRRSLAADKDLGPLARAGGGAGAPDKAKLDALAEKLAQDPHAREAAREALQAAARAAEATPELRDALERAARAAASARGAEDKEKIAPALQDLARALAEQPSARQDEKAKAELAKAKDALERARSAVSGDESAPSAPSPTTPEPAPSEEKREELAKKIPPELLAKALDEKGADSQQGTKPPITPEDAKKLLDKLPQETLEKLAKAAQEAGAGKLDEAAKNLGADVKKDLHEAQEKADEERGIPPEALAKMAEMVPPELIAKAMKMAAEKQAQDPSGQEAKTPPISAEDAQKVLEKLSPKTLEKLAKAAMEASKDLPAPKAGSGDAGGLSPEQAQEIAKKLSPETVQEIAKAARASGVGEPGQGAGSKNEDSGAKGVMGRQGDAQNPEPAGNPKEPSRVSTKEPSPEGTEGPTSKDDPLVKNSPRVSWSRPPEKLPVKERDALRAALEKKRVPASYEKSVREYFDLGKQ